MPNLNVFFNSIDTLEVVSGIKLLDREEFANQLLDAWEKDETQAKNNFLQTYNSIFKETLKRWTEREFQNFHRTNTEEYPSLAKNLMDMERNMKNCALALIPELRHKSYEDVLFSMTFGNMDKNKIVSEFNATARRYATIKTNEDTAKWRQESAYDKVKDEWKNMLVRNITDLAYDKKKLQVMSQDEKIDYLCALNEYKREMLGEEKEVDGKVLPAVRKIGDKEIDLIDNAISSLMDEVGFDKRISLNENIAGIYHNRGQLLNDRQKVGSEVNKAIEELNKNVNIAQNDIEKYNASANTIKEFKSKRERVVDVKEVTDDTLEAVADMFSIEEKKAELKDDVSKEKKFLDANVEAFNKKYGIELSEDKFYTSIDQLSRMMMNAERQKEDFLDPDKVVVIQDGKETCYDSKSYYKEVFLKNEANKNSKITYKNFLEKEYYKNHAGRVFEINGEQVRSFKAGEYFETHETSSEKYVYSEYQRLYARIYKETCEKNKERGYAGAKETNFTVVTKDVNELFKSAMFTTRLYDNPNNRVIVEKCSFGGFTIEQLSNIANSAKGGAWALDQKSEEAWRIQSEGAKSILKDWTKNEKSESIGTSVSRIQSDLTAKINAYKKGEINKKELIENTIAGEAHLNSTFDTRRKRIFSFIQYRKELSALKQCRATLGLHENDSLRVALSNGYVAVSKEMNSEKIFSSVSKAVEESPTYESDKERLTAAHKAVKESVMAEKQRELDEMLAKGREPIEIPELDERKNIVNGEPRSKAIEAQLDLQLNVGLQKNN